MRFFGLFLVAYSAVFGIALQEHRLDIVPGENWLRKPGQERWEMQELDSDEKAQVLDWAEKQGFFSDWAPSDAQYDTALIFGGSTDSMQKRMRYLVKLWNEGVRFCDVVWLVGERPLDARVDGFMDRCATEEEAARLIWKEAEAALQDLPVTFIAAPMKGTLRPNTEDTIRAWLPKNPCKALFISNQPFCGYQFAVVKSLLPPEFVFDVVGPGKDPKHRSAAVTLDTLARWYFAQERS